MLPSANTRDLMPRTCVSTSGRSADARKTAAEIRLTWPIRTVLRLQREERLLQLDFDAATTPKARQDAAKALIAHRAALADLMMLPRRPAGPRWKEPTASPSWYHRPGWKPDAPAPGPVEIDVPATET